jgi:hypothetical protein
MLLDRYVQIYVSMCLSHIAGQGVVNKNKLRQYQIFYSLELCNGKIYEYYLVRVVVLCGLHSWIRRLSRYCKSIGPSCL